MGCMAHLPSYSIGYMDFLSGIKRPGREFDHLHQSCDVIENDWSYASTPPPAFMAWTGITLIFFYRTHKYVVIDVFMSTIAVFQYDKEKWAIQNFGFGALKPCYFLKFHCHVQVFLFVYSRA
jgi:hypothetical protein